MSGQEVQQLANDLSSPLKQPSNHELGISFRTRSLPAIPHAKLLLATRSETHIQHSQLQTPKDANNSGNYHSASKVSSPRHSRPLSQERETTIALSGDKWTSRHDFLRSGSLSPDREYQGDYQLKETQRLISADFRPSTVQEANNYRTNGWFLARTPIFSNKRTTNGLGMHWIGGKAVATELGRPGLLEIESVGLPSGALEPITKPVHLPVNSMHPYTKEELSLWTRMESRVRYVTNPRFPITKSLVTGMAKNIPEFVPPGHPETKKSLKLGSLAVTNSADRTHSAEGVVAIPPSVTFSNYQPGQVYEKEIIIKNVTQNSRRFRFCAKPPYVHSSFFAVRLTDAPADHGKQGLVAPGMSLKYKITFTPNSLADFERTFIVSTEMGQQLEVPVRAKREAPRLTLPPTLDCGPSRAGYENMRVWDFRNEGGPARFLLVREDEEVDPYTVFDKLTGPEMYAMLSEGPFTIFPSYFAVKSGESGQLILRYNPAEIASEEAAPGERVDTIRLKLVCDNCQITSLPITGLAQRPGVQVTAIAHANGTKIDKDSLPHSAGCDITLPFGEQNPQATSTVFLTVINQTLLPLPFQWVLFDIPGETSKRKTNMRTKSAFSVEPQKGSLPPMKEVTFEVTFQPDGLLHYDIISNLVILHNSKSLSDRTGSQSKSSSSGHEDCGLSIRCSGQGVPYRVKLDPPILLVPATLHPGTAYQATFQLSNESVSQISFEWYLEDIEETVMKVSVSTPTGELEALACCQVKIRCTGVFPGKISGNLICRIANGPIIRVPITANVTIPPNYLQFHIDCIDFGLIALGSDKTVRVSLVSNAPVPLLWKLKCTKIYWGDQQRECYVTFYPSDGLIDPGGTEEITINYVPVACQRFLGLMECQILDRPLRATGRSIDHASGDRPSTEKSVDTRNVTATVIGMRAQVLTPRVTILNAVNSVSCFKGVPFKYVLLLQNVTMLPARFQWKNIAREHCNMSFTPNTGEIAGGEELCIYVEAVGHHVGVNNTFLFECCIDGMVEHKGRIGAKLNMDVRDIDVVVKLSKTSDGLNEDLQVLNFGNECPIFANRTGNLVLQNRSAIAAPFHVWVENFAATSLEEEDEVETMQNADTEDDRKSSADRRLSVSTIQNDHGRSILKSSKHTKLGFSSSTGMEYISKIKEVRRLIRRMHILLRDGRGAAFHASPGAGTIQPWQTVNVKITSYNNLVGMYSDTLTCEVLGWGRQSFPVHLGVVGLPVRFAGAQLVASKKESPDAMDRVNFGTRITNLSWASPDGIRVESRAENDKQGAMDKEMESYSKWIQIENQSPRDIVLDWAVYIKHTQPGTVPPTLESVLQHENKLAADAIGVFDIEPKSISIQAFKTTSMRVLFRSAKVGNFDGIVIADVGYVQENGSVRYGLGRPSNLTDTTKPSLSPSISISHLSTLARLYVQGGAIDPRLSLDIGDKIRIKFSPWNNRPNNDTGQPGHSVNVFLKNNSDAVCSFRMRAIPETLFSVSPAESRKGQNAPSTNATASNKLPASKRKQQTRKQIHSEKVRQMEGPRGFEANAMMPEMLELKPTEQMLLSIEYKAERKTESHWQSLKKPSVLHHPSPAADMYGFSPPSSSQYGVSSEPEIFAKDTSARLDSQDVGESAGEHPGNSRSVSSPTLEPGLSDNMDDGPRTTLPEDSESKSIYNAEREDSIDAEQRSLLEQVASRPNSQVQHEPGPLMSVGLISDSADIAENYLVTPLMGEQSQIEGVALPSNERRLRNDNTQIGQEQLPAQNVAPRPRTSNSSRIETCPLQVNEPGEHIHVAADTHPLAMATGELQIIFSNGMIQSIPIYCEAPR